LNNSNVSLQFIHTRVWKDGLRRRPYSDVSYSFPEN